MISEKKIAVEFSSVNLGHYFNENKDAQTWDYFNHILRSYDLGKKIIDLGAGHGKYSILCRDKGYHVTATDARPDRMPVHEKNIKWLIQDVSDTDLKGYDTVLCLGLLYHLTLEKQIALFRKMDCGTLILNTHTVIIADGEIKNSEFRDKLSSVYRDGKIEGAIYKESNTLDELKARPLAAFSNTDSFWHTTNSLCYMLREYGGFSSIDMLMPEINEGRTFIIAKK